MKLRRKQAAGYSLVELMIVVALVALLAVVSVPNFLRSRSNVHKSVCIENLHQIDQAMQHWALEQRKGATSAITFQDISPYLKYSLICPAGGSSFSDSYAITTVSTFPSCQKNPFAHLLPGFSLAGELTETSSAGDPGKAISSSNGQGNGHAGTPSGKGPDGNGPPGNNETNPGHGHGP